LVAGLGAALLIASVASALADKRVALVVGNASYAELGTLANPTNDADDIAATLRGMGFEVTLTENADERKFTDALSNFANAADGADVALFYYSGHGLQYASENYLVPVDALLTNRFSLTHETIALNDVLSAMSNAHTALVYIDACRSFPLTGTFFGSPNERVAPVAGLAPVQQVHNTFVGFSASAGQTARDGSGRNSPFTAAMLDELPTPGLDVAAMFSAVSAKVVSSTAGAQKPQSFSGLSSDVALVAGALPTAGNSTPGEQERAYHDVAAIGTVDAYRAFISRYPGGLYSELARAAMNKLLASTPMSSSEEPVPSDSGGQVPAAVLNFIGGSPSSVAVALSGLKEANFAALGDVTQTMGSWKIAQTSSQCTMYTEAVAVQPGKWLTFRPWIYFQVSSNSDLVRGAVLRTNKADGSDLVVPRSTHVYATTANATVEVPALLQNTELGLLSPCANASNGPLCYDVSALSELASASRLTVTARTPSGADGMIAYNVTGFTDAARRINSLCKAHADFLFAGARQ